MRRYRLKHIFNSWLTSSLLMVMITTYTLIIGTWAVNRFMSFNATLWDMGIMIQAIWNTAHGSILHESVNLGYSVSRLAAAHWELIYLPLAVVYRIFPSIPLLLYLQSFVLACGAIPIFKFAEKQLLSKTSAFLLAIAYLCYPAMHGSNLFDLHGLTFATTLLLFTFYYLDKGEWIKAIITALLSICCREDVAFVIFMLGTYILFKRKTGDTLQKRGALKVGAIFISMSLLWLLAFFTRAYFTGQAELAGTISITPNWENSSLHSIPDFLRSPLLNTISTIQFLCSFENIKYIAKLILPVAGLCCLAPEIFLIAAPILLLNMLSNWPQMHQIEYHYTAAITPFIFLAAINGISNLKQWLARFPIFQTNRIQFVLGSIVVLASVVSTTQFSILRFHERWYVSESNKKLSQQLYAIPSDLSVSASARVGAHLANRAALYHFPEHWSDVDMVIIELNRAEAEIKNFTGKLRTCKVSAMNEFTQSVFEDSTLGLKFVQDNVFCLQRDLASKASFAKYAFLQEMPSKAIAVKKIDFGKGLYFWGWQTVYISDQQAHFQLFWFSNKKQSEQASINFHLTSVDSKIAIPHQPLFGRIPIHDWPPGKIICDHLFIDIPTDEQINTFSVMVSVSDGEKAQEYHLFKFNFP